MDTKKLLYVIGLILILNTKYLAQELKLELSLDKKEYFIMETILVKLLIINSSPNDIIIDNLDNNQNFETHGLFPKAVGQNNPKGLYLPMTMSNSYYKEYKLPAGDTAYYIINLAQKYSNASQSSAMEWRGQFIIEPDTYSLNYMLTNGKEKTQYFSNTVEFCIKQPSEKEKAIFFECLDSEFQLEKLKEMVNKYPNSRYNHNIFKNILYLSKRSGRDISKVHDELILADTTGRFLKILLFSPISSDEKNRILLNKKYNKFFSDSELPITTQRIIKYHEKRILDGKRVINERKLKEQSMRQQNEK